MICLPDELLLFVIEQTDALFTRRQLRLVCRRLWRLCPSRSAAFRIVAREMVIGRGGLASDEPQTIRIVEKLVSELSSKFVEATALSVTSETWLDLYQGYYHFHFGVAHRLSDWEDVRDKGRTALQRVLSATAPGALEYLRIDTARLTQWPGSPPNEALGRVFTLPLPSVATHRIVVLEIGALRVNPAFFAANHFPSLQVLRLYTRPPSKGDRDDDSTSTGTRAEYSTADVLMLVHALGAYNSPLHTLIMSVEHAQELAALVACLNALKHLRCLSFVPEAVVDQHYPTESAVLSSGFCWTVRSTTLEVLALMSYPPFVSFSTIESTSGPVVGSVSSPTRATRSSHGQLRAHIPSLKNRKRLGSRPTPGQSGNGVYDTDLLAGCTRLQAAFPSLQTLGWLVAQPRYSESSLLWCERRDDGAWVYTGEKDCWPLPNYGELFSST